MPSYKATSNIFGGGYTKEKADKVKATKIPEVIRCDTCNKLKPNVNFSERQLGRYRHKLAQNPRLADSSQAVITCTKCTPSQVTELECSHCYQVKALQAFTKAQRKDPERARCMHCVNLDLKEQPAGETEATDQVGNDDNDDNNTVTNPYANSNVGPTTDASDFLPAAASRMKLEDSESDDSEDNPYAPASAGATKTSQHHGGVAFSGNGPAAWAAFSRQNESSRAQGGASYTGYDPAGNPHQRHRAPSTIGSIQSTTRSAPGSNFPKIKADKVINNKGDPPGLIQIPESASLAVGRQAYTGDDSDSDDDYGYI